MPWPWDQIPALASLDLCELGSSSVRPHRAVGKIKKDPVHSSTGWHLESAGQISPLFYLHYSCCDDVNPPHHSLLMLTMAPEVVFLSVFSPLQSVLTELPEQQSRVMAKIWSHYSAANKPHQLPAADMIMIKSKCSCHLAPTTLPASSPATPSPSPPPQLIPRHAVPTSVPVQLLFPPPKNVLWSKETFPSFRAHTNAHSPVRPILTLAQGFLC